MGIQLGPDYDLAVRLAALEQAVARLTANPLGSSFSQTQSDGTLGFELSQDPNSGGTAMAIRHGPQSPFSDTTSTPGTAQHPRFLYIGQLDSSKLPTDAIVDNDAGFVLLRDDGTPSIIVTQTGGVQVFDKGGVLVLATDEQTGGVATAVTYPQPQPVYPTLGYEQTSGSLTPTLISSFINYSPRLAYQVILSATSGAATGSAQIVLASYDGDGGVQNVVSSPVYSNTAGGVSGTYISQVIPLDESWIGKLVGFQVNAAAGSSPANVVCSQLYGVGTLTNVVNLVASVG